MCCLSLIQATEKLKHQSGNFPRGGGIWTAFRPGEGGIWTKIFPKNSNARGLPAGDVEASICLVLFNRVSSEVARLLIQENCA